MRFSHVKFRSICAAKSIKQKHLVDNMGISKGTASNWQRGIRQPKDEEIPQIANLLGVPVEDLLEGGEKTKRVDIADQLSPKAKSILKMIAEVEGIDENEAMSRAIQGYGATLLQGSPPTKQEVPIENPSQSSDKEGNPNEK